MVYKDPEARKKYWKKEYAKNREKYLARSRQQRAEVGHKEHIKPIKRSSHLKTRYGITEADYQQVLAEQGGCCAACKATVSNNGRKTSYFDVDHDHESGMVRGVLCRRCNVTLGVMERNRERIVQLEKYLDSYLDGLVR